MYVVELCFYVLTCPIHVHGFRMRSRCHFYCLPPFLSFTTLHFLLEWGQKSFRQKFRKISEYDFCRNDYWPLSVILTANVGWYTIKTVVRPVLMVTEYATPRSVPFFESKFLFVLLWGRFCFFSKRIPRGTRFEVFSVTIRTCLKNNKSDTLKWPHTSVIFFQEPGTVCGDRGSKFPFFTLFCNRPPQPHNIWRVW
jgi:hypothetical protein